MSQRRGRGTVMTRRLAAMACVIAIDGTPISSVPARRNVRRARHRLTSRRTSDRFNTISKAEPLG